jgi:hypothetical protein
MHGYPDLRRKREDVTVAGDPAPTSARAGEGPSAWAVSFVTTEHFTLEGARSATISESTGRATMFLGAVSGGLVALGLIGAAAGIGPAFYAFGLVILPTLVFVGLVTFDRALQSGLEDYGYARRIARLRAYYFQHAPELVGFLASVPATERLRLQGLRADRFQPFVTVAGMVAVITAVLAGSSVALVAAALGGRMLPVALGGGIVVGILVLVLLMHYQALAWNRIGAEHPFVEE